MDGGRVVTIPLPSMPATIFSDDPQLQLVHRLSQKLAQANVYYDDFDLYYSGDQPLAFLAPEVAAQVGNRLAPLVINWPETIVDSVNRRVQAEGFLLGQGGVADDELWRIWTANEMHHESQLGQIDALVHGKAFISVWGNDEDPDTPLMTFESAHQMDVMYEPGTGDRVVSAGLKRWQDEDVAYATLYLPDRVVRYRSTAQAWGAPAPVYDVDQVLDNPLGAVPIVPMVNKGRLLNRAGRSELASIAPIADGINKLATDMMVTSEFFQSPRRWATGIQLPVDAANRERLQAEATAYWDEATKKKTWLAGQGVQFGQFPEADLGGFASAINLLTSALASIGGLPPDDLGLNQVNPASAEARRAAETVLVLRAIEKQSMAGRAYTRAQRFAVAARDGVPLRALPTEYSRMSVDWKDPATQAIAQEMDAASKGKEAGIYDLEAAQSRVGMGPAERLAMKARSEEAAAAAATADVRARMDMARELTRTDGLTLNAAMAAVGLLQAAATNSAESGPGAPQAAL
jgi:hypothetical protein